MAKTKAQTARPAVERRRRAQADSERSLRILILGGAAAVIAIAAGVIAFGWYQTHIKPLTKTVLQVGNTKYSLAHLERRMKLLRTQDPTYGDLATSNSLLVLPDVTLGLLEREGKLLEAAGQLNVTVTDEEVAAEIRDRGGLAADVEASVYASEFKQQVDDSGLKQDEYLKMIKAYLLGQKLQDYFRFIAPTAEAQVRGQYIVFDDEAKANEAVQRLRAGDPADQVATELGYDVSSSGSTTASALTPIEWTPRADASALPTDVQDFLFGSQLNAVSEVIASEGAGFFYVAQLLEKDDNRTLDDAGRQTVASREANKWFDGLDSTIVVKNNFTTEDRNRALNDIL
jgi:parvulin-like peptidyl-prolyl isomerase